MGLNGNHSLEREGNIRWQYTMEQDRLNLFGGGHVINSLQIPLMQRDVYITAKGVLICSWRLMVLQ